MFCYTPSAETRLMPPPGRPRAATRSPKEKGGTLSHHLKIGKRTSQSLHRLKGCSPFSGECTAMIGMCFLNLDCNISIGCVGSHDHFVGSVCEEQG